MDRRPLLARLPILTDGSHTKNYYVSESVGVCARGLFVAAVHHMGLATLTHTPNPMKFLGELLERPSVQLNGLHRPAAGNTHSR